MKPADIHLWEKFITAYPDYFSSVDYDVHVGEGEIHGDLETDKLARGFQRLTQKKIDVVGYKDGKVILTEVKPIAGSMAFGQMLAYFKLWSEKHPEVGDRGMLIITDKCQSDFAEIYADNGIKCVELGFCAGCLAV